MILTARITVSVPGSTWNLPKQSLVALDIGISVPQEIFDSQESIHGQSAIGESQESPNPSETAAGRRKAPFSKCDKRPCRTLSSLPSKVACINGGLWIKDGQRMSKVSHRFLKVDLARLMRLMSIHFGPCLTFCSLCLSAKSA